MRLILALFSFLLLVAPVRAQITADSIHVPISNDPATGFPRIAYHQTFVITPDLNMVQEIRVVTMHPSGVSMRAFISADTSMSAAQKAKALLRYADQIVSKSTTDSYLNASTGKLAQKPLRPAIYVTDTTTLDRPTILIGDPDWKPDPAIVTEKRYFQHITLGALKARGVVITDKTAVAQLIYQLLSDQIKTIDGRGEL